MLLSFQSKLMLFLIFGVREYRRDVGLTMGTTMRGTDT